MTGDGSAGRFPADLFAFEDPEPPVSLYAYAPVFRVRDRRGDRVVKRTGLSRSSGAAVGRWCAGLRADGVDVVVPEQAFTPNPRAAADGVWWVVYPFVDGRPYGGLADDIAAAGRLLGAVHAADQSAADELAFCPEPVRRPADWITGHAAQAVQAMREVGGDCTRFERLVEDRNQGPAILPDLAVVGCSADFKASNLVFGLRPVLVDPDNAARMPRLYDLAVAALLFHNDAPYAPHRLWTRAEWIVFLAAYEERVALNCDERRAWSAVLALAWLDQGVWLLANFPEGWADPAEAMYLRDLACSDLSQFTLDARAG